jgi:hypothetical protein
MRFFSKAPFYYILLFLFSSSCKKEKVDEDCGCNGPTYRTLENRQARYTGDGTFAVSDSIDGYIYVSACDLDNAWEINNDEKAWNYTISGNVKKRCPGPNHKLELPAPGGPIQITYIKKI